MRRFKIGNIVVRKSYNKDLLFEITDIIKTVDKKNIMILKGITERIEADSYEDDLEIVDRRTIESEIKTFENKILNRIKDQRTNENIFTGKILHLDGDKRYSEKSMKYYKSLGLNAVVKNIKESKQPYLVKSLLDKYKPDILIITGHDGMIKKGTNYNDIYNYRNSKYFIEAVNEARKWKCKDLAIFAGACQSYYEAIILAGANFASSPGRIMIDFIDPLIVAETIATTDRNAYISIADIRDELRDGEQGISGVGCYGKKNVTIK